LRPRQCRWRSKSSRPLRLHYPDCVRRIISRANNEAAIQNDSGLPQGPEGANASGYALANAGHDTRALQAWLGHKNIQHTVRYTELAPDRFKNFWRD
jgi:site-specific recombinase XerD